MAASLMSVLHNICFQATGRFPTEAIVEIINYQQLEMTPSCVNVVNPRNEILSLDSKHRTSVISYLKVPIAPNYKGVCLQNTSKSHSYHLKIWQLL